MLIAIKKGKTMLPSQKIEPVRIFTHNAKSSKLLLKAVSCLFGVILVICGFLFSNFYGEFKDLEGQVNLLEHNFDTLKAEFNMLVNPLGHPAIYEPEA